MNEITIINMPKVLNNGLTREKMIDKMVEDDINMIRDAMYSDNVNFLDSTLRGEGWIPYNQLSDEGVVSEYAERDYPEEDEDEELLIEGNIKYTKRQEGKNE